MNSNGSKQAPSRRERARTVLLLCVAALALLFALLNTGSVHVDWVIGSGNAPLIVVIAASVLVGILCCYLIERVRARRDRNP